MTTVSDDAPTPKGLHRHPGPGLGFEDGEPVPTTDPDFGDMDSEVLAKARKDAMVRLTQWYVDGYATRERVGAKVLIMAYLLELPIAGVRNRDDLARLLGIQRRRLSQICAEISANLEEIRGE